MPASEVHLRRQILAACLHEAPIVLDRDFTPCVKS